MCIRRYCAAKGCRTICSKKKPSGRGVAIFAKAFMGIPAQQAAKITRPLMPSAAPAVLLHSLHTQQGVCNIVIAMTRRDFGKPAFSLRIKRFVKTHALSLLGTTRLLSRSGRDLGIAQMKQGQAVLAAGAVHPAWLSRGTFSRSCLPSAIRSSRERNSTAARQESSSPQKR